jgi:hypothetical protein
MTLTTTPTGTGSPEPAVNDQAAVRAEAREQVRHGAAHWLTGDQTAALGRQMVLSITRYRQANRRSPTWAEALAGVDPSLCEPMTTPGELAAGPGGVAASERPSSCARMREDHLFDLGRHLTRTAKHGQRLN